MKLKVAVQMDPIASINPRGDSTFAMMLEAQARGPEHGRGSVSGVEFAVDDFFPDGGPPDFATEIDLDAVPGEKPALAGDNEGSGVGQREKTDTQRAICRGA